MKSLKNHKDQKCSECPNPLILVLYGQQRDQSQHYAAVLTMQTQHHFGLQHHHHHWILGLGLYSESRSILVSLSSSPSHSTSLSSPISSSTSSTRLPPSSSPIFSGLLTSLDRSWKPRFQKIITLQPVLQSHFCKLKTKVELFFYKVQSLGGCELMLTFNSVYQKCTLSTLDAGNSWRSRPQP